MPGTRTAMIPVVTVGGALPAVIGAGSAGGCYGVLLADGSPSSKAAKCAGITVLAWGLFAALLLGVTLMQ